MGTGSKGSERKKERGPEDTTRSKTRGQTQNYGKMGLSIIFGVCLLIGIIWWSGFQEVWDVLVKVNILYLLTGMCVWLLLNFILSIRIKKILEFLGNPLSYSDAFWSHMAGLLASDITPSRVGYFATAFILHKDYNVPISKGVLSLFGPQLYEFLWKVIVSFVLFVLLIKTVDPGGRYIGLFMVFIAAAGAGLVFLILIVTSKKFLGKFDFLDRVWGLNYGYKMIKQLNEHGHALVKEWKIIWLTIFAGWILKAIEWFLIAEAIGIRIHDNPIVEVLIFGCMHSFIFFLQFVPFPTVAGTGFTEGISTGILVLFGVSLAGAVAFSVLSRLILLAVDIPFGMVKITHVSIDIISSAKRIVVKNEER